MSRNNRRPITKLTPKQRSKQREGLLTEAQTRDKRFRKIILEGHDRAGPDTHWYAVRIIDRKTLLCAARLTRKGLIVVVPEQVKKKLVNGYSETARKRRIRTLPGFVFVGINNGVAGLSRLYNDPDVWAIVGRNGQAARLRAKEIDAFLFRVQSGLPDGALAARAPKIPIEVGDNVQILRGPFLGNKMQVVDISGRFAKATYFLFGHECRVLVDLAALERVDVD